MPTCVRPGCGKEFAPGTRGPPKKYCSKACGNAVRVAAWQAKNPEKRREHYRAWQKRNPEALRWYAIIKKYGLTREAYDAMVVEQCGRCDMCGCELDGKVDVDHDHATNKVRALLCHRCNVGLPYVEDLIFRANAVSYLARHS